MLTSIKSCNIIYGYQDNCLPDYLNSPIILIEPRSDVIDKIKTLLVTKTSDYRNNIVLVTKVLCEHNKMMETILYYNNQTNKYWINEELFSSNTSNPIVVNGTNLFNVKKYKVYTTSIQNIILQYSIQNIETLLINIPVDNLDKVFKSIVPFNHIISNISFDQNINEVWISDKTKEKDLFSNYNCKECESSFFHKNLNIELPNIGLYFINTSECKKRKNEISLLLNQYKMSLVVNNIKFDDSDNSKDFDHYSNLIPYPDSVTVINNDINYDVPNSKIYFENVILNLEFIFNKERYDTTHTSNLDIIIQFNPKYLNTNNTLQIMYPLKDNTIYINKMFDIIYATKNCMYMLYQILKSKYFTDYIDEKRKEKPTLISIFSKRYFYDYIAKMFVLKEF